MTSLSMLNTLIMKLFRVIQDVTSILSNINFKFAAKIPKTLSYLSNFRKLVYARCPPVSCGVYAVSIDFMRCPRGVRPRAVSDDVMRSCGPAVSTTFGHVSEL